ncbi:MAG: cation diffusion facilitator family transporter, partial [Anaerohalosphaera sp.]|nr:cation diffusion facilitator family transporter [Anaerohalosphaera sp.]
VHSPALYANAWHHRSDALSSVVVVLGFIAHRSGYVYADQFATVVVGLMIIWVAVTIIRGCLDELVERAVDSKTLCQIESVINAETNVKQWHKLRTRNVGREIFLDLHILVDPLLTVTQAHDITDSLSDTIRDQLNRPVNITIHVEPDIPELRK